MYYRQIDSPNNQQEAPIEKPGKTVELLSSDSNSDTISINSGKDDTEYLQSIIKSQNMGNTSSANFTIKLDVQNKDVKANQMRLGLK